MNRNKVFTVIRGIAEIIMCFYLWFNWATVPSWMIFLVCLSIFLEGISSILEGVTIN